MVFFNEKKFKILHKAKHSGLLLTTREKPEPGQYKYFITSMGTSHTAFHTEKGLNRYLKDTGIKRGEKLNHLSNTEKLIGTEKEYSVAASREEFNKFGRKKRLIATSVLSNGDYTRGFIEKKKKGGNIIYLMNPNYDRVKLKYRIE